MEGITAGLACMREPTGCFLCNTPATLIGNRTVAVGVGWLAIFRSAGSSQMFSSQMSPICCGVHRPAPQNVAGAVGPSTAYLAIIPPTGYLNPDTRGRLRFQCGIAALPDREPVTKRDDLAAEFRQGFLIKTRFRVAESVGDCAAAWAASPSFS